jgi:hypothetical protein
MAAPPTPHRRRRLRVVIALAGGLAAAASIAPSADAAALARRTPAQYWATSDELVRVVLPTWDAKAGAYTLKGSAPGTRLNSSMLYIHALAASSHRAGPSRQDGHAVQLVRRLISSPAFLQGRNLTQAHSPGWGASLDDGALQQHVAIDAQVAEALGAAYAAGPIIGLTATDRARIRDRVCRVAASPLYQRPRLNQVNWMSDVYDACVTAGGSTRLLRVTYRRWLVWFLEHARTPIGRGMTSNLNAGLGLHYLPHRTASNVENQLPTTEYNNIIVTVLQSYDHAVRLGMKPLPARLTSVARRWQGRILYGEWMQSGYLNWDSGLGFARWHLRRYWAWSADGLLTIAQASDRIGMTRGARSHAIADFNAALDLYTRIHRVEAGPGEHAMSFGLVYPEPQAQADWLLVPARFAALAARAADTGFGGTGPAAPPSSYGYDPDIHRLTIATSRYSAAIVPGSRVGNGGAELSRLYDASGAPVSGTGGSGATSTAFGLRVLQGAHPLLETQPGVPSSRARLDTFALPRGGTRFAGSRTAVSRATSGSGVKATITHRFAADAITVYHRIRGLRNRRVTARFRFPAYGRATFTLATPSGDLAIGTARRAVSGRVTLRVRLRDGRGYDIRLLTALPAGTTLRIAGAGRARSAPVTRSTLLVELPLRGAGADVGYRLLPLATH